MVDRWKTVAPPGACGHAPASRPRRRSISKTGLCRHCPGTGGGLDQREARAGAEADDRCRGWKAKGRPRIDGDRDEFEQPAINALRQVESSPSSNSMVFSATSGSASGLASAPSKGSVRVEVLREAPCADRPAHPAREVGRKRPSTKTARCGAFAGGSQRALHHRQGLGEGGLRDGARGRCTSTARRGAWGSRVPRSARRHRLAAR
jgi:hypothetical protein